LFVSIVRPACARSFVSHAFISTSLISLSFIHSTRARSIARHRDVTIERRRADRARTRERHRRVDRERIDRDRSTENPSRDRVGTFGTTARARSLSIRAVRTLTTCASRLDARREDARSTTVLAKVILELRANMVRAREG